MKNLTISLLILFFLNLTQVAIGQNVVINEIQSSNSTVLADENGDFEDWIELYNNGSAGVNLAGYGLSDDPSTPFKWVFPNVTIASKQYLLIWASDKNRTTVGNPLHTNFKINSAGEIITLTAPSGTKVDSSPAVSLGKNISYGRMPNGTGSFAYFTVCTPNAANSSSGIAELLDPPTFSVKSGFFTQSFNLTLSAAPGTTIYYTVDGSEPDPNNLGGTTYNYKNQYPKEPGQTTGTLQQKSYKTLLYNSPISIVDRSPLPNHLATISSSNDYTPTHIPENPIYKGTVVRAIAVKTGAISSKVVSNSYFISPLGANRYSFPVVSLSTNEDRLFDYNIGINVAGVDFDNWRAANPLLPPKTSGNTANFFRRGKEYEKAVNFTYFENGKEVLNQDVGLRIHGGSSRVAPNRSFVLYANSDQGDDNMNFPFFPEKPFNKYQGIVLHNSGNDYDQTMFRDALCHELMKSLNMYTKGYKPAVIFINGEYWGVLSFRDKIDDEFFKRVYNISKNDLDVLEENYTVIEGDNTGYLEMVDYLETHSLASQANYEYITTQLDPVNFTDYFISNIFLSNNDWPMNNIIYWRKKTGGYKPNSPYGNDGRWRWQPHDLDATFINSASDDINHNTLADCTDPVGSPYPNPPYSTLLLRKLLENNTYKINFINRFADLLNTTFLSSRILSTIDKMKAHLAPETPELFARWKKPLNDSDWNYSLNFHINFANLRPAYQRNHIRSKFGITSNINAILNVSDVNAGHIKMNTIDVKVGTDGILSNPYPWTGIYFSGIPVTIKAVPKQGYTFSHWSGASTSTNPEITVTPTTNFSITAVFELETTPSSQPIYYWMMDSNIKDNSPLEALKSTYKKGNTDGIIHFQSCLVGYPFVETDENWGKATMERRNNPSEINYFPELNNELPFLKSYMKGLQIKEPLHNGNRENTLVLDLSTIDYKDIRFSFAATNELTNATSIIVEYAINSGTPVWISTGLSSNSLALSENYKFFNVDFSSLTTVNNNPNFKVRLRFSGSNMTADTGARITFNNIAVHGKSTINLSVDESITDTFTIFPNPVSDKLFVSSNVEFMEYKLLSMDGRLIRKGNVELKELDFSQIPSGIYLLQLIADGKSETKKIVKN